MNEFDVQDYLLDIIYNDITESGECEHAESFEDRGILTNNAGIVLRLKSGAEFQLTIVKSSN